MARGWIEDEAPLRSAGWAAIARLQKRGRASWRVWLAVAVAVTAALTVKRALEPPRHGATVVMRVSEGAVKADPGEFAGAALNEYVQDVVFTNKSLIELLGRYPAFYRGLAKDPASELEDFRKELSVSIQADTSQERTSADPPLSARIALTFHAPDPDHAWQMAHDLANLLVDSTRARQRALATREGAAAKSVIERAGSALDATRLPVPQVQARLRAAEARAAGARVALGAVEDNQSLRFQIVDQGRIPRSASDSLASRLTALLVTLTAALLASWLLAGAFDPRVTDAQDVAALGLPQLGRITRLPQDRHAAPDSRDAPQPDGG